MNYRTIFLFLCFTCLFQVQTSFGASKDEAIKLSEIKEICLRQRDGSEINENYLVRFYQNGAVVFEGRSGMKNIGLFAGKIPKERFQQLAKLMLHAKFFSYADRVTDELASDYLYHDGRDVIQVIRHSKEKDIYAWVGDGITVFDKVRTVLRNEMQGVKWKFQRPLGQPPKLKMGGQSAPGPDLDEDGNFVANLRGVAMAGPANPVAREGETNENPLANAVITIQPEGGGNEITRKCADKDGRFEFVLNPGTYLLVHLGPQASDVAAEEPEPKDNPKRKYRPKRIVPRGQWIMPRGESQTVVIERGKVTEVVVHYDIGIR